MRPSIYNYSCPKCSTPLMAVETIGNEQVMTAYDITVEPVQAPGEAGKLLMLHCPKCGTISPGPTAKAPLNDS